MIESRVAPGLLIAMPQLLDPNFARSVVLMVEHNAEGSLGVVLNRPGRVPVVAVMRSLELPWSGDAEARVGFGGPVQPGTLWILHQPVAEVPPTGGTVHLLDGSDVTVSPDQVKLLAVNTPRQVRFFLGYAGWGPGQLAAELVAGAWLHAEASPDLVFDTEPDAMWEKAIGLLGADPAALTPASGVH